MVIKKTKSELGFDVFNTALMILFCLIMLYPLLYVVSHSFMTDADRVMRPLALIPHEWTIEGYAFIFSGNSILLNSFGITMFRTIIGTVLSLILESMFAYVISKKKYPMKNALTMMVALTMWFDGGLIPKFLLIKSLGFMNSIWVYVIPTAMSVWNILILRNFFAQIPDSIEESARIDGANEAVVLFKLIIPLSTAVLATVALFHVVGHWNEWFTATLYVNDKFKQPAMVILRNVLTKVSVADMQLEGSGSSYTPPSFAVQMATIVVVAFPILVAYPFFQKYFTKGMMMGSIKG